jgi:hypothetical protein
MKTPNSKELAILRKKFKYSEALNRWCAEVTPIEWIYIYENFRNKFSSEVDKFDMMRMKSYVNSGYSNLSNLYMSHRFNPEDIK